MSMGYCAGDVEKDRTITFEGTPVGIDLRYLERGTEAAAIESWKADVVSIGLSAHTLCRPDVQEALGGRHWRKIAITLSSKGLLGSDVGTCLERIRADELHLRPRAVDQELLEQIAALDNLTVLSLFPACSFT